MAIEKWGHEQTKSLFHSPHSALRLLKEIMKEQSQSKFLADVAHEFQTPLAILRMTMEMWPRGRTAKEKRARQIMDGTLDRLTRLTNGLLLAARLDYASSSLPQQTVNIETLISETCEDCLVLAENKGLHLQYANPAFGKSEECLIASGDRDRLKEVLLNLLSNAFKHTAPGGLVSVTGRKSGNEAQIAVTDTGSGIARENLPKIFERFYRINDGTSPGVGIGLHLSRQIIEAHGGTITVESEIGKGTCFFIRLPLAPQDAAPHPKEKSQKVDAVLQ